MTRDNHIRYALPSGWRWQSLHEICVVSDRDHRTPVYVENGVPLISPKDFTESGIDFSNLRQVERAEYVAFVKKCNPAIGDVMYSRIGTIGEARLLDFDFEFVALHSIALIKPIAEKVHSKFLLYLLQAPDVRAQARHNIKSVGTPDLGLQRIRNFGIPLPPLSEQQRIVAEIEKQFTHLDAGVAALRRVRANLKRYRAAVLKAACEGRLVPTEAELARAEGRTYETGEQLLARILADRRKNWQGRGKYRAPPSPDATKFPPIPDGWTWATLEQLCPVFADSAHRTPKYESEGIAALGPRDVVGGKLDLTVTRRVSETEFAIQSARRVPEYGDVIYSRELSLGWGIAVPKDLRVCMSQGMCLFRPHDNVDVRYFLILLNGPLVRRQAEKAATGSAHPHINLGDIKAYTFSLPPMSEQERIVAEVERRLSVAEELEATVTVNIQRAAHLRQSILQRVFTERR